MKRKVQNSSWQPFSKAVKILEIASSFFRAFAVSICDCLFSKSLQRQSESTRVQVGSVEFAGQEGQRDAHISLAKSDAQRAKNTVVYFIGILF